MPTYKLGVLNRWGDSLTGEATTKLIAIAADAVQAAHKRRISVLMENDWMALNNAALNAVFDTIPQIIIIDALSNTKDRRDAFRLLTDAAAENASRLTDPATLPQSVVPRRPKTRTVTSLRNGLAQSVLRMAATGLISMHYIELLTMDGMTTSDLNSRLSFEFGHLKDIFEKVVSVMSECKLIPTKLTDSNLVVEFDEEHLAIGVEEVTLAVSVPSPAFPETASSSAPKADESSTAGADHADKATHTTTEGTKTMTVVSNAALNSAIETNAFENIDPMIAGIINNTLTQVGLPTVTDIASGLKELADKAKRGGDGMKLALGEAMGYTPSGPTTIPAGKCVTKKASEVFGLKGAAAAPFNFEVPTYEWDGPHPHVPAIDPAYQFQPQQLMAILVAIVTDQRTWLYGDTGCGKTTVIEQIAARLNYPVIRVNFDSEITRMDLIGAKDIVVSPSGASVTTFTEGVLPSAMQMPCIFLADELDFIRADVAYVFQRVLEGNGLTLPEDGGRIVRPHPGFRIVATGNTRGDGDDTGRYQGAKPQSAAFLDRFTTWVQCDYMSDSQVKEMLVKKFPSLPAKAVESLTGYAREHWAAFKGGQVLTALSPRGLLSCAMTYTVYSSVIDDKKALINAMKSTFVDRASREDAQTIQGLITRVLS